MVRERLKKQNNKREKELKAVGSKIESIGVLKNKALTKNLEGIISDGDYKRYTSSLDLELKNHEETKARLASEIEVSLDSNLLETVKKAVNNALNFDIINREMLNRFIAKIEVYGDKTIKIHYRFAGLEKILNASME